MKALRRKIGPRVSYCVMGLEEDMAGAKHRTCLSVEVVLENRICVGVGFCLGVSGEVSVAICVTPVIFSLGSE